MRSERLGSRSIGLLGPWRWTPPPDVQRNLAAPPRFVSYSFKIGYNRTVLRE